MTLLVGSKERNIHQRGEVVTCHKSAKILVLQRKL